MNLKILFSLLLVFIGAVSKAQDDPQIDLKIGFSFYKNISRNEFNKMPNLNMEVNYFISRYLKSGLYLGASYLTNWKMTRDSVYKVYESSGGSLAVYYGANINFSLLKILTKTDNLKLDCYALARIGGRYIFAPEDLLVSGNDFIWGSGLGISYQFNKKIGAFVESIYGNNYFGRGSYYSFKEKIDFKYGIVLKY